MPANLKVIKGPMFSGKSTLLIRLIDRAVRAGKKVLAIKPATDIREYGDTIAARFTKTDRSEEWVSYPATVVKNRNQFARALENDHDLLIVDEGQFCGDWIVPELAMHLMRRRQDNLDVVVSGLDLDFALRPFGPMPELLAMADQVECLTAICSTCGSENGRFTERLVPGGKTIMVGDKEYTASCRTCHKVLTPPKTPTAP